MANDTDILFGPLENLRDLVAASTAFRTLVGAEDAAAAKGSIYIPGLAAGVAAARPFAVVDQGEEWNRDASGRAGGSLFLLFEIDVAAAQDDDTSAQMEAAHRAFMVTVGTILDQMIDASVADTAGALLHLRTKSPCYSLLDGPNRTDKADRASAGDFYQAVFQVYWGIGA